MKIMERIREQIRRKNRYIYTQKPYIYYILGIGSMKRSEEKKSLPAGI